MEKEIYSGTNDERYSKPAEPLLTKEKLKLIAPNMPEKRMDVFLPYINRFAPQYGIDTPVRMASFLAQVLHESLEFQFTRELWGPTPQQRKYERDFKEPWNNTNDRNKLAFALGNAAAGDGAFFKGHGLIHITGKANHKSCSMAIFGDDRLLRNPELLTVPEYAVQSAMWYWDWKNINKQADTPGIEDETRKVNGGLNGLHKRQAYNDIALKVL